MQDELRHECALFGVYGAPEQAVQTTYWGLWSQQHRGQESAGIATTQNVHVGMGLAHEVLTPTALAGIGDDVTAIGHLRYSTTGHSTLANAQPLVQSTHFGRLALAMNGNLVNARELRALLEAEADVKFATTTDAEILIRLLELSNKDLDTALADTISMLKGAFCFLLLQDDNLYAFRDPHGFRPLCLGEKNGATLLASESCAFDHPLVQARYIREIGQGEILCCRATRGYSLCPWPKPASHECVFEHVYFSRPDSMVFGREVWRSRQLLGAALAREDNPPRDAIVVAVPDSGIFAAYGYAQTLGLPRVPALTRNHFIGRTFIDPDKDGRAFKAALKLNPVRGMLVGKKVILVDDSIIRGTTSRQIVSIIREAGAVEVHMRISCPPTVSPCFYGVDTPTKSQLIAANVTIEEVCAFIEADSLRYLSLEGMHAACGQLPGAPKRHCDACFTGDYPIEDTDFVQLRLNHPPTKL